MGVALCIMTDGSREFTFFCYFRLNLLISLSLGCSKLGIVSCDNNNLVSIISLSHTHSPVPHSYTSRTGGFELHLLEESL